MSTSPETSDRDLEARLAGHASRDLLRLLTCGSVDDGKSTLIGRLLHDSDLLFDDQVASLRANSQRHGSTGDDIDLALVVDGLQAERERGITIDVAYRYFATTRRRFIIADTPGHEQYTRNMATGASNCNLAMILVDAQKGIVDQTRRHAFIAALLGVRHLTLAVNKMDLVDWSQERFDQIVRELNEFAAKLQVDDVRCFPISALHGDNIVRRSDRMAWYQGSTLLHHLETVHVAGDRNLIDLRFPVQIVLRSKEYRGYAGTVASGTVRVGSEITVLPSGRRSRVRAIDAGATPLEEASAGMPVALRFDDEIDLGRGDMIVTPNNVPRIDHQFDAMVVWMSERPMDTDREYILEQTTVQTRSRITDIHYRMNVSALHREPAEGLSMNEVGRVSVELARPLAFDAYTRNRATGAFILIDPDSNETVGAGTILDRESIEARMSRPRSPDAGSNVRPDEPSSVSPASKAELLKQTPFTVWFTGLPRSGKSSIARALEARLFQLGCLTQILDGEALRRGISADLGFGRRDRREHARRTAELARVINAMGGIAIVALVSPSAADREMAREIIGEDRFVEVWCNATLGVCEERDEQALFERARKGELQNVPGFDVAYEVSLARQLELDTEKDTVSDNVRVIIDSLTARRLIDPPS